MADFQMNDDYVECVNRVIKHIDENLESKLTVENLSELTFFSKFHFHKIFTGATGETLAAFVIRRRLERAISFFKHAPELSVTDVALRVGFQSPEHFSRSFKDRFGITAKQFRDEDVADPQSLKNRKIYQELSDQSFYHVYQQSRQMPQPEFEVQIRELPKTEIAYISETFGEDGTNLLHAYNDLMDWAKAKHLFVPESKRFAISRDDIEITPANQYRMEFCISVPPNTETGGRISNGTVYGGTYALIHVVGDIHKVAQAWDYMYQSWLPSSRYHPIDEPAVEIFCKGPEEIGWEMFDLEVGVPVSQHKAL